MPQPLVLPDLVDYLKSHCPAEDPFLADLRSASVDAGLPPISVSASQAHFMQILLRLVGAREVVEVGTLGGYSAISMARALPQDGRVRTIELEPGHAAFARRMIAESDVAERVEVIEGAGADVLPTVGAGSVDAAFLDADKQSYLCYAEECSRILRPGGLLMADNGFAFGLLLDDDSTDAGVLCVREFNDAIARDERWEAFLVPVGDGCWVARKRG